MYKISVPMVVRNIPRAGGKEKIYEGLVRIGADRVILALGAMSIDRKEKWQELELFYEYARYFKEKGLKVASWMWTFMTDGKHDFTQITSHDGTSATNMCCPLDDDFCDFALEYVRDVAKGDTDLLMLDDDFRFGFMGSGFNCTCPMHMKKINAILGEEISPTALMERALSGGKNKYRDAWMKVNGEALLTHAKKIRKAVDDIDPKKRIGFCSCISVWDQDGIDSLTLAKTLAGNTKPYMRLIGAPYWAVNRSWGNRLQNVIEIERIERAWCGDGVEIYAEGDAYPRPRINCPASYLELFDIAIRASGGFDGIQKYALDYVSTTNYEKGYIDRHVKNKPVYDFVDKHFDKNAAGVRVYEKMQTFADMQIPPHLEKDKLVFNSFFSPASKFLADNSVPTVHEGEGVCSIAFGENVRMVTEDAFKKGVIIDTYAARVLMERGIDVGIKKIGERVSVNEEAYCGEYQIFTKSPFAYNVEIKEGAKTVSAYNINKTKMVAEKIPACFEYTNADGYRFLVYTIDSLNPDMNIHRAYFRIKQINDFSKLPAFISGNPDLYVICKRDETSMAAGLFNIFADEIISPEIILDKEYSEIECINCTGKIEGNKVMLSDIPPFSFAGFNVKKST